MAEQRTVAATVSALGQTSTARAARETLGKLRFRPIPEGGILVLLGMLILSLTYEAISPFETLRGLPRERLMSPEWGWPPWDYHILGTDQQGRDVFLRLIVGAKFSLQVAFYTVGAAGLIGVVVGISAGYFRGWIELTMMRIADAVMGLPIILAALVLAAIYRPSLKLVIIALLINLWAGYARVLRGETLSIMTRDFIKLARVAGAGPIRIMLTHVFPHVVNTFVILLTLQLGVTILAESSLSFLGAGIPPPNPAWGGMAAQGRQYIQEAWWVSLYPGLAIGLIVLVFNLTGDWLRDKLDPQLQ